jgi:large subunit ribosomal protein L16
MKQLVILKKNQKSLIKVKGTEKNRIFFTKKKNYLLKSNSYSLITSNQLKSAYNCMKKKLKKSGHLILHIFPVIGLTKKPIEVRMGKGKGSKISFYAYPVRPGKILFELEGVNSKLAKNIFSLGLRKISIKSKIISI